MLLDDCCADDVCILEIPYSLSSTVRADLGGLIFFSERVIYSNYYHPFLAPQDSRFCPLLYCAKP